MLYQLSYAHQSPAFRQSILRLLALQLFDENCTDDGAHTIANFARFQDSHSIGF